MSWLLPISISLAGIIALYLATVPGQRLRIAHLWLAAALGLLALLHSLTALITSGFDLPLTRARPALAMAFPALLYLHARAIARPSRAAARRDTWHLAGPLIVGSLLILTGLNIADTGAFIDVAIFGAGVGYATGIALLARAKLTGSGRRWLLFLATTLALITAVDGIVSIELLGGTTLSHSIGLMTGLIGAIALLGVFLLSTLHRRGPMRWIATRPQDHSPGLADRLRSHMEKRRPWTAPDLTVARLARQMTCPQRHVSETVNSEWGMSVSQWINSYRVHEAQRLMALGPDRSLVDLMLDCGFQTRSNFNKAFRDVTGLAPSQWRQRHTHPIDQTAPTDSPDR